jgi:hypothetical protein
MKVLDQWLILDTEVAGQKLIQRFCRLSRKKKALDCIGVPLPLANGKWAQCVEGFEKFLTEEERQAIVGINSFRQILLVV